MKIITLKPGRERSLLNGHPWIFSGSIEPPHPELPPGTVVEVWSSTGACLGVADYWGGSLAAKVLSRKQEPVDKIFLQKRIERALALRRSLGLPSEHTNAYRLMNAEGDALPGLIIDVYGDVAVTQFHSLLLWKFRTDVSAVLEQSGFKTVYDKSVRTLQNIDPSDMPQDTFLLGKNQAPTIRENGALFSVDIVNGQKTGFFLDQRDNRSHASALSQGKRVLNLFSYTGGFSIAALRGAAAHVTSVDSSEKAQRLLEHNQKLNGLNGEHQSIHGDAFQFLERCRDSYDLVICDPPAFAKKRRDLRGAIKKYSALNALALERVAEHGLLMTFSCSQLVSLDEFVSSIQHAFRRVGRSGQVLRVLQQAPCHPCSLQHPEGPYLKGLLVRCGP